MSQHNAESKKPGFSVLYGWDRPMGTYFAIVTKKDVPPPADEDDDEEDPVVLWLGGKFFEFLEPELMVPLLAEHLDLTPEILARLRADEAAAPFGS